MRLATGRDVAGCKGLILPAPRQNRAALRNIKPFKICIAQSSHTSTRGSGARTPLTPSRCFPNAPQDLSTRAAPPAFPEHRHKNILSQVRTNTSPFPPARHHRSKPRPRGGDEPGRAPTRQGHRRVSPCPPPAAAAARAALPSAPGREQQGAAGRARRGTGEARRGARGHAPAAGAAPGALDPSQGQRPGTGGLPAGAGAMRGSAAPRCLKPSRGAPGRAGPYRAGPGAAPRARIIRGPLSPPPSPVSLRPRPRSPPLPPAAEKGMELAGAYKSP